MKQSEASSKLTRVGSIPSLQPCNFSIVVNELPMQPYLNRSSDFSIFVLRSIDYKTLITLRRRVKGGI